MPDENEKIEVVLSEEHPLLSAVKSEDLIAAVKQLPASHRRLIERAAAKVAEADKAEEAENADAKLKREQHDQSLAGRKERQEKAAAK